jgi:hypothetical protein
MKDAGGNMKVMSFLEYCPEDFEKILAKFRSAMADREKGSKKFPKYAFTTHGVGGEAKTVQVYEDPTEEQLNALVIHYMPEGKFKFVPLLDAGKFIEQYNKEKKK